MDNAIFGRGLILLLMLTPAPALAATGAEDAAAALDRVEVIGRRQNLVGTAISASEGAVGVDDVARRPLQRAGDLIEFVPGLVATQHSGSGKANQYFLRGFNLDHGTDFATWVDGMPVNLRTHGHGQGYTDLNFLIPELVDSLRYRKGTYYADVGDFSAAGSAQFSLRDRLDEGMLELGVGRFGWRRAVAADSQATAAGELLLAGEWQTHDGPWTDVEEAVGKRNLLLRHSGQLAGGRLSLTVMGYRNDWNSPDQVPQRAIDRGLISRLGSLDTTLGGESSRNSLSAGWEGEAFGGGLQASAYAIDHELSLWSNFTYFLDDAEAGDQFEQRDARRLYGANLVQQWQRGDSLWQLGGELRRDDIDEVGLFRTRARQRLAAIRDDRVVEDSLGLFLANETRWTPRLRSYLGLRHDAYEFDVHALQAENSGSADDALGSAKASLAYQASDALDLYASWGQGLHSNDARGTTLRVDPVSGEPAEPVDPLVRSRGAELGLRWQPDAQVNATLAVWNLSLDSELLFVGDAGTTEASRPSARHGVELGVYWLPDARLAVDAELAWTRSRFRDADPAGRRIPGAIPRVANLGLHLELGGGWQAGGRLRYFDAYPLIEDGSQRSRGSTLLTLRLARTWQRLRVTLDLHNALDSDDHDIDYFYTSRLRGEPAEGVDDIHFHPLEPRSWRLGVSWRF